MKKDNDRRDTAKKDYIRKIISLYLEGKLSECHTLGQVATVKKVNVIDKNVKVKKLTAAGLCKHDYDISKCGRGSKTDTKLKTNDIVIHMYPEYEVAFITKDMAKGKFYAGGGDCVIRAKRISPEFLFLFLQSEIGREFIKLNNNNILSENSLLTIPIPSENTNYQELYTYTAETIAGSNARNYSAINTAISTSMQFKMPPKAKPELLLDTVFFDELNESCKSVNDKQLIKLFKNDIEELNKCQQYHLYKAGVCLAGSILEAFLIDWISEITGRVWFDKDYIYICGKTYNSSGLKACNEGLRYFFSNKGLPWYEYYADCEEIRELRNRIHITPDKPIVNDKDLENTIKKLKKVIESRLDPQFKVVCN